jgi:4-amino-4-deoxy-L-arabinose transferase-like glycosyltransferase
MFSALPILELRGEEPRRAIVAIEMMLSDNIIVPTIHGENYYNKPPLFNWVLIVFFKLFNSFDEWVVRIPSTLGFILTGLLHFFITKKYVNKNVAYLSTLFLFTTGDILFHGATLTGEIDLFYSLIVYAQIICLFVFYDQKKYFLMYGFSYLLMVAGFFTKGLPSIVFQGFTLVAMAIFYKDFRIMYRWQHILSGIFALFLIILYFWRYNQFTDAGPFIVKLFNESSEKSAGVFSIFPIIKSVLGFPFFLISKMAPWSLLIVLIFFKRKDIKTLPANKFVRFSILFVLTNIIIYWLTPAVRIRYLYMFLPFLWLILAYYISPFIKELNTRVVKPIVIAMTSIVIIIILVAPFLSITKDLVTVKVLTPFLVLLIVLGIYFYRKYPQEWVLVLALLLLVLRFEMQLTYWPISHMKDFRHKEIIEKAVEISKENKIYYLGEDKTFPDEISLGPLRIFQSKTSVQMPEYINYKIPFYLAKKGFGVLPFHKEPIKGSCYITDYLYFQEKSYPDSSVIFKVRDKNSDQNYIIFRLE